MQTEKIIGVWRHSRWTGGFWWRAIVTLGVYALVADRQHNITLTDHRVTERTGGLIGGSEISISLSKVTDVRVKNSALGSMLGYGDIMITGEGEGPDIEFKGLAHPDKLRQAMFSLQQGTTAPPPVARPQ